MASKEWRTLKLEILAETKQFLADMDKSSKEVESFGGKLEKFSAAAKAAFLAAGAAALAYAGKLAVQGVQAAIADEAAQKRLETALKNATGATNNQIAAVEKQITKLSLATGVADDNLRPALQKLATATGDVDEAQKLLNLALDISAGTGKDVETVSLALAKAYDGNTGAITRLGVGLSAAEVKALGFEGTTDRLQKLFGGAATTQAETFEGRIARLKVAFNEAKESVGAALLPIIEKLIKYFIETGIPAFEKFKKNAIDPVIKAFKDNEEAIKGLYDFAKGILVPFLSFTLVNSLKGLSTVASTIVKAVSLSLKALEPIINAAITGINAVIIARNLLSSGPDIKTINKVDFTGAGVNTGSTKQSNTVSSENLPFGGGSTIPGKPTPGVGGNLIAAGTLTPSVASTPSVSTTTIPVISTTNISNVPTDINGVFNPSKVRTGDERVNINITVNGAVDPASTARQIANILNSEAAQSGTFTDLGVSRFSPRVE